MFKSVFARYLSAFALIIFVSFFLLAIIIASLIGNYSADTKKEDLTWAVDFSRFWLERKYADANEQAFLQLAVEDGGELSDRLDAYPANRGKLSLFVT